MINKKILVSTLLSVILSGANVQAMTPQANSLYQQACSAEYKEDYKTAIEKLTEALAISPDDVMIYTKLAGVYSEMGEYDKALNAYQKVAELKPTDGYIYISVGSIYENQGKYKEALSAYNKVMEMCPEYLYNYLNIGNAQYQLGDYKSAIGNYNKFLSTYSQHREARENLAASYLSDGNYQSAVNEYANIYAKNPSAFKDFSKYGLALFEVKNYEKAAEFLEKAVDADPDNSSAHINLALSYQELGKNKLALSQYDVVFRQQPSLHSLRFDYGNLLAEMDKEEAAIENYKIYIENYPQDARAYQNIAIVYRRLLKTDDAIANYEKALKLQKDKRNIEIVKDLAECYHLNKDYANAIKYYDEVLASNPDNYDVKYNKAVILHSLNRYNDAIVMYNELLKVKDNEALQANLTSAYIAQGDEYLKSHNYSLATEYFEKAVERNTNDSYAYFGLAQAYRACDVNDKATEYFEKAITMSPDRAEYSQEFAEFISATSKSEVKISDTSTGITEVFLTMDSAEDDARANKELILTGDENYKNKNYDLSVKNYQDALKLNPADEVTLLKLGNIYKIKNDSKNAINFYKKSIVVNPNYSDGWFNLGLVYASDKNNNKAKECFHRVISLNPNYGYAYYALGLAYEQDGNTKEALNNYKIFLVHNSDEATGKAVQEKVKQLENE